MRKNTLTHQALRSSNGNRESDSLELIAEEPLLIRIDGNPFSVVMRTPGDERFHAMGFCLAEGIIDCQDDITAIGYDEHLNPNVINISLKAERREKIPGILRRRSFISQTSCGICGKQLIEEIYQKLTPIEDGCEIDVVGIHNCMRKLFEHQKCYRTTKGCHAALLLDDHLDTIAFAEDVGRHNALDKAVGKALMEGHLSKAQIVVLSSRTSHELVQKAARAQLPIVISHSRPTALAVELAKTLKMTIVFPDEASEAVIFCGENRIKHTINGVLPPYRGRA